MKQFNFPTFEELENIKIGMTRKEILLLLGQPSGEVEFVKLGTKGAYWSYSCKSIDYRLTINGNRLSRIWKSSNARYNSIKPKVKKKNKIPNNLPICEALKFLKIGMTLVEVIEIIGENSFNYLDESGRWVYWCNRITFMLGFNNGYLVEISISG